MDVVLRTPNGDAEVSIGSHRQEVTLGDLVETVTGRPAPAVVYVDHRAVSAVTALDTAGVLMGSIISTVDDLEPAPIDGIVELIQVAGVGSGTRRWLTPGRYRIGVGRRLSAAELDLAPVDEAMLELDVAGDGTIDVRSTAGARLDGASVASATRWETGLLDVGGRVFALGRRDPRAETPTGHRSVSVPIDGVASFNRPPRRAAPPDFEPLEVPDGAGTVGGTLRLAGANWWSERRSRSRDGDNSSRTDRQATSAFSAAARERHRETQARARAAQPDIARAIELADTASSELWQRRPGHPDVFRLPLGLADLPWSPELHRSATSPSTAQSIVNMIGPTILVPAEVDFLGERGLGVVGGTEFARSVVSALLVEAAVTHGPADLDMVVLSSSQRVHQWDWVKWLPHARVGGDARIFRTVEEVAAWAAAVRRGWEQPDRPTSSTHVTLVVVDEPSWWRERNAPLRIVFSDPAIPLRFVAITTDAADVPAVCTTVITEHPDGVAAVDHLLDRRRIDGVVPFRLSEPRARAAARRLASLDDPDVPTVSDTNLPSVVPLLALLGLDDPSTDDIVDRWSRRRGNRATVTIGMDDRGPLQLDLVADGPHALIAGTAGAGTSELLRSLVVGLATEMPPDDINFVLVDVTGGSAFGACSSLPHTVGLVTDLAGRRAGRLLRCLRAELLHREHILRAAGAASFDEYQQLTDLPRLPCLVLVVDEIAPVAAELPEFLTSLVDVAQRGRSLGLHMVLATQRPGGAVDDRIRATTELRIALRLHDDGDSLDVIGTNDAARLRRRVPGRAYARLGGGELIAFQSAYCTGFSAADAHAGNARRADVRPFVVAREPWSLEQRLLRHADSGVTDDGGTDLTRLVSAIAGAAHVLGQSEQRRPCPDPLPDELAWEGFAAAHPGDAVPFALLDLPDEQRQIPVWWTPGADGSLLVYGNSGAGTSSLLVTLALGVAQRFSADDVHIYGIDADTDALAPLDEMAHVGAVVRSDELDRVARLVAHLSVELDRRTGRALESGDRVAGPAAEPVIVILVDDVGALRECLDERRDLHEVWPDLERVIRDGPPHGICAVLTAKQDRAVPGSLATQIPDRLVMRLDDPVAYATFGLTSSDVPDFVPGRAVRPDDATELQVVSPPASLAVSVAGLGVEPARHRPVERIDRLPGVIGIDEVIAAAELGDDAISVPVGLDVRDAGPALSVVPFGENVIVAGPPGSGRSSVLTAFARAAASVDPELAVFAVAPRGGPLAEVGGLDRPSGSADVSAWVDRATAAGGRRLVLVDDADRLDGPDFERLGALRDDEVIVVVAGRADDLGAPGHWSRPLQRFRHAVLLRPEPSDGDLVQVSLGLGMVDPGPHRGVLVVEGDIVPLLAATATPPALPTAPDGVA